MRLALRGVTTTMLAASARSMLRAGMVSMVSISDAFDSGNIERLPSPSDAIVALQIKPDPYTELEEKHHSQWFAFRATHDAIAGALDGADIAYYL